MGKMIRFFLVGGAIGYVVGMIVLSLVSRVQTGTFGILGIGSEIQSLWLSLGFVGLINWPLGVWMFECGGIVSMVACYLYDQRKSRKVLWLTSLILGTLGGCIAIVVSYLIWLVYPPIVGFRSVLEVNTLIAGGIAGLASGAVIALDVWTTTRRGKKVQTAVKKNAVWAVGIGAVVLAAGLIVWFGQAAKQERETSAKAASTRWLNQLKDADARVRTFALLLLDTNATEHVKDIAVLLKDKDGYVRAQAACALATLKATEYAKDIAVLLKDTEARAREYAVQALGILKAKEYAKDVAALLKDAEAKVRASAVDALGDMEAKEYAKDIILLLKDANTLVNWGAASRLKEWGYKLKENDDQTYEVESAPK